MSKVIDKVAWVMGDPDDKLIKLEEAGKTYDISDVVYEYLKKANLLESLEDKNVEVEVDESTVEKDDSSTSGTITKLIVLKEGEEPKKEETKKEEPVASAKEESGLVVKEVTVAGVSVAKGGVKLKEDKENKVWYTLDSTISPNKFKDECTGKMIEITVLPQEKGNDVIKGYVIKEEDKKEEKKEEKKDTDEPKINKNDAFYRIKQLENQVRYLKEEKSESFEAQAAVNSANQAVSGMKDIHNDPEKLLRTIEKIAEKNFEVIQKLKTKKE